MPEKTKELKLNLDDELQADDEALERATRQLREELMGLDVEDVGFVSAGEVPAKAKAGDPVTWGTLLLTLAASGGVFTTVISAVQSWLTRADRRSITLEIEGDKLEIKGISSEEQQRLINEWLTRRSNREIEDD